MTEDIEYYYCIYCGRALEIIDNVIMHDDVWHDENYDYPETEIEQ